MKKGVIFGQCQPFEPTTKICSGCGHQQAMALKERTFRCQACALSLDRDYNAAINILHAGASALGLEIHQTPSGAVLYEASYPACEG